jgi:hypothetical protein
LDSIKSSESSIANSFKTRGTIASNPAPSFYSTATNCLRQLGEPDPVSSEREGHTNQEEESISNYVQDAQFIREQENILKEIQSQHHCTSNRQVSDGCMNAHPSLSVPSEDANSYSTKPASLKENMANATIELEQEAFTGQYRFDGTARTQAVDQGSPSMYTSTSRRYDTTAAASMISFNHDMPHPEPQDTAKFHPRNQYVTDLSCRVGRDKNICVKGTWATYDAIACGNASLAQCSVCLYTLQIPPLSTLLFCVMCESVTPVALTQQQTASNPQQKGYEDLDERISRVVQNQEKHVANARNLDKKSRPGD